MVHKPAFEGWEVLLTCGNTDGCHKTFEMLLDRGIGCRFGKKLAEI